MTPNISPPTYVTQRLEEQQEAIHLVIWRRREEAAFQRVLGQVVGVGHHQVSTMEVCREHKGGGADPFHHSIGLWRHLQAQHTHRSQQSKLSLGTRSSE